MKQKQTDAHRCSKCQTLRATLYFVSNDFLCWYCVPVAWLDPRCATKLIKRSILTIGETIEQMEKFAERIRDWESDKHKSAVPKVKPKRQIFNKTPAYFKAVAVFADGEFLTASDVMARLPEIRKRSVERYLADATRNGELLQPQRGSYSLAVQTAKNAPVSPLLSKVKKA